MQKQTKPTLVPDLSQEARLVSVEEAALLLAIDERTVWRLFNKGALAAKKLGSRTLVAVSEIDRYIGTLPDWKPKIPTDRDSA